MKIDELMASLHRVNFNMEKELKVKTYLPIEEKKAIAQGIIYECTEEEDGVVKIDSLQRYLSYVKFMLKHHTNLEYDEKDYDKLCSTEFENTNLLNAIMATFAADAKECSRILDLMTDDYVRENSLEFEIVKLIHNINLKLTELYNNINGKLGNFDINSILPENFDMEKLDTFLNKYIK